MLLPVGACKVGIADRVSCMIHAVVALIDTDVRDIASCIIGGVEKDQIPSLCLCQGDMLGHVILVLRYTGQADTSLSIAPLHQTATVKAGVRVVAPVHICPALIFQRFIHDRLYRLVVKVCDS